MLWRLKVILIYFNFPTGSCFIFQLKYQIYEWRTHWQSTHRVGEKNYVKYIRCLALGMVPLAHWSHDGRWGEVVGRAGVLLPTTTLVCSLPLRPYHALHSTVKAAGPSESSLLTNTFSSGEMTSADQWTAAIMNGEFLIKKKRKYVIRRHLKKTFNTLKL